MSALLRHASWCRPGALAATRYHANVAGRLAEQLVRSATISKGERSVSLQAHTKGSISPAAQSQGLQELHVRCARLAQEAKDLRELQALASEEGDGSFASECETKLRELWEDGAAELVEIVLDTSIAGCFIEVHSGEGGIDAMDWCGMLGKMYESWAEVSGCRAERVAEVAGGGESAGFRSLTLHVTGPGAAMLLEPEAGAHRLIRISPFDRRRRRHTSFAAVLVLPDTTGQENRIATPSKKDLKVETMRSSGPGGQSVNVSDTAVRITHLPTNVSVRCQQEASQIDNMKIAMKLLMAKLEARAEAERRQVKFEMHTGAASEASAAAEKRVRSYTLDPQELVKDHRSSLTSTYAQGVLTGVELQPFLECGLLLEMRLRHFGNHEL